MVVGSQLDREIGTGESKQSTIKNCRKTQNGHINNASKTATLVDIMTTKLTTKVSQAARSSRDQKNNKTLNVKESDSFDTMFSESDMWTSKYAPSSFGTFVGNMAAVATLENWLQQWKDLPRRSASAYHDSSSSSGHPADGFSNAMFIKGPPGVGKTALVYYIAQRLGYTVLEVNSSSERSGRRVLADLKEATQSLHVEGTKVSSSKGRISSFFKPVFTSVPTALLTSDLSEQVQDKKKQKGKEKQISKEFTSRNCKGTISFFFASKTKKGNTSEDSTEILEILDDSCNDKFECEAKELSKSSIKSFFEPVDKNDDLKGFEKERTVITDKQIMEKRSRSGSPEQDDQRIKCSKSTIILFDDVDVIFDNDGDEGFWMALETVLKSSKKPCILTATRDYGTIIKRCRILQDTPVIELHRPSPTQVAGFLRKIGEAEKRDLTGYNVEFTCQHLSSDVRRALLQIEFETVSSRLPQTIYPVNKTFGALLSSGCLDDAASIQMTFKKSGFNAFYASLEECLPFEFEDIVMRKPSFSSTEIGESLAQSRRKRHDDKRKKSKAAFNSSVLCSLAEIFDQVSQFDLFAASLDTMGEECLPSYERVKRWMEQRPVETQDTNPRLVEELLEIGSTVLIGEAAKSLDRISRRCADLTEVEQQELYLPRVASSLGFRDIHKILKKVRTNERALDDILSQLSISRSLAKHYLFYLSRICQAEKERRSGPNRKGRSRFLHYLAQIGMYLSPDQVDRLATLWS
ncbi:ATPase family AAA domain-containing protein 5-like isoform X2 [Varroa jacobsoni]|nr:ATPase family AAA domain-containing protein 5-like isoform X2 [Varroa jacobsoni]